MKECKNDFVRGLNVGNIKEWVIQMKRYGEIIEWVNSFGHWICETGCDSETGWVIWVRQHMGRTHYLVPEWISESHIQKFISVKDSVLGCRLVVRMTANHLTNVGVDRFGCVTLWEGAWLRQWIVNLLGLEEK